MTRTAKILCATGCVLLLVTAVLHGAGYLGVRDAVSTSNASAFLKSALPGMWLHFSIHLAVLVAFGILALFSVHGARGLLVLLALAVAADAALVFSLAGFFVGVALLVAAALCFALAATLPVPHSPESHGSGT